MISCDLIRILRKTLLFFFPFLPALLALARTSSSSCILVERCTVDLLFMKLIAGRLDPQVINSVNNRPVNKSGILHGTLPSIMHRASALSAQPLSRLRGNVSELSMRQTRGAAPHSSLSMATSRYSLDITLPSGHANGITVLQFSPDGKFLASGSGDGVLLVFSTSSWKPVKRFIDASSINTLVWHPVMPKTLICGYASGDVHTTRFESHELVLNLHTFIANPHANDSTGRVWE